MHIDDQTYTVKGRTYRRVLLRKSYRQEGKVKVKTIANISHCTDEEIEALKIALKNKGNLKALENITEAQCQYGKKVGAVAALHQTADKLGIKKALGNNREAKLVMWLVFARILGQGSRLSAVRLAQNHAACEIIGLDSFNEDDLYQSMNWLCQNQNRVEEKLFKFKRAKKANGNSSSSSFFLYDLTSSYLEGDLNELADWGYNRDKKKGKKQIVCGLLTDGDGDPVAVEAYRGNTADSSTVGYQVDALLNRFGCQNVAFVGDKGSIKTSGIEAIQEAGFNYITSITKPQIRRLLVRNIIQMDLFDVKICEVTDEEESVRYILRRNPERSKKMARSRDSKIDKIKQELAKSNKYLAEHPLSRVSTQLNNILKRISKLKLDNIIQLKHDETSRTIVLFINTIALQEESSLDGCYILKTDLPCEAASCETVHQRYKDLALVEKAFRTFKTGHLEVRPVYLRNEERTRAHIFITMLAYKLERFFRECWKNQNLTVQEGFERLSSITALLMTIGSGQVAKIAKPNKTCASLLDSAQITLPNSLPYKEVSVVTRKSLPESR